MDFFLGGVTGFVVGFGLLYINYHKSEMSTMLIAMRMEVAAMSKKFDILTDSISKKTSS
jgi:hypothetical protein